MAVEDQIIAAGFQIIWILEENRVFRAGTAQTCQRFKQSIRSGRGICVGDGQTQPTAGTFDNSPFSVRRGFDMAVRLRDMRIMYTTTHGTPRGNDNPTGAEVLQDLRALPR